MTVAGITGQDGTVAPPRRGRGSATLRQHGPDDRDPAPERRLRASRLLAGDDAGAARSVRTRLPDAADVVVIGGGYAGINAARELARRGVAVTLLETHTLGWGASTRNGGIVHSGLQVERPRAHREVRRGHGQGALPGDARLVPAGQAAHRRRGHRLRVPRGRPPGAGLRAVARPGAGPRPRRPRRRRRDLARPAPRTDPRGDRHGRVLRRARRRGQRAAPSRASTSPGWRTRPTRAGADLHEGVRARSIRRQADGRFVVETSRGAILARDVFVATNGYTDGVVPDAAAPDHGHRLVHHRVRAAARGPGPRAVAQRPVVLRHQELPVLLARLGRTAG